MTKPWEGTPFEAEYHRLHDEIERLTGSLARSKSVGDGFYASIAGYAAERDDAVTRMAAALAVLREVEWSYQRGFCPVCDAFGKDTDGQHKPGCKLAAVLMGAP